MSTKRYDMTTALCFDIMKTGAVVGYFEMSLQKNHKRFQSEEQVFTLILGEPEEL
jgi:hypothetical protein